MSDVSDTLSFLSQSQNRAEVLTLVYEETGCNRYEIEEQVDASRRTVIRALDALTDRGYIEKRGQVYRTTSFGSFIAEAYQEFVSNTTLAHQVKPFLANVSDNEYDLDPKYLDDAEVVVTTPRSPYALLDRTLAIRREADQIREVAPFIERKSVEQLVERIEHQESFGVEAILPEAAVEAGDEHPEYREAHQQIKQSDQVNLYIHPGEISLPVCIADDTVIICVLEDEKLHALVLSSNREVKGWAESRFETIRNNSNPL